MSAIRRSPLRHGDMIMLTLRRAASRPCRFGEAIGGSAGRGNSFGCALCLTLDGTTATPYVMHDDAFEWDERKAAENDAKHGVTFETARVAFTDPFAIDWLDRSEDYGEDRFAIVGMVEGRLIIVVYTLRGEKIRLISARRAEPFERRRYHEENRT